MTKSIQKLSKTKEESWKDLWHQPCHARGWTNSNPSIVKANAEPQSSNEKEFKTMSFGMVESRESTRQRAESLRSKTHEDRIVCKSFTSMTHSNLVHKFFPMQQAMKIPDGKAAVDKEWKKLETIQAWDLEKKRNKGKTSGGQGDGVPKASLQQAVADPRGAQTCVCASSFLARVAHARREGRMNVLPWYRPVGVVRTSSESHEGKTGLPARVRGHHVVWG